MHARLPRQTTCYSRLVHAGKVRLGNAVATRILSARCKPGACATHAAHKSRHGNSQAQALKIRQAGDECTHAVYLLMRSHVCARAYRQGIAHICELETAGLF
eukprot:4544442-Pleurochrysis_carterae.AAC.3